MYVATYRSASTFSKAPTLFLPILSVVGTEIRSIDFRCLISAGPEHFSRIFLLSIMLLTSAGSLLISDRLVRKLFVQPCQPRLVPRPPTSALPKKTT
jgi:hypothetical protein